MSSNKPAAFARNKNKHLPNDGRCYCNRCNIYSTKLGRIFIKKAGELFAKSKETSIKEEIVDIMYRKYSLRPRELERPKDDFYGAFRTSKAVDYTKIKHINNLYKYLGAPRHIHFSYDFIIDDFMKISYMKAKYFIPVVNDFALTFYESNKFDNGLFIKKNTISNSLNNFQKFINRYEYQKYYIIYIIQQKIIPTDLVRLVYDFVY